TGQYAPNQSFLRWAYAFARNDVMAWMPRHARSRFVFDDEVRAKIADCFAAVDESRAQQLTAREGCVEKLPERQRELVTARYGRGEMLQDIAARMKMPENAAAALFYRLRKALATCVEISLGKETTP